LASQKSTIDDPKK